MYDRLLRTAIAALVVLTGVNAEAADGTGIQLKGWAGVGGVAKANRWTPLVVAIDSPRAFTGRLLVTWGDLRLTRHLSVPSPGRRQIELLLRTADPEAIVRLQLVSDGSAPMPLDLPLEVLPQDQPVTLCVASPDGATGDANCTAATSADLLPRSLRGYESVDRIVWPGSERRTAADQQAAIDAWQSLRRLEDSGDLGLAPAAARPAARRGIPSTASRVIGAVAIGYVIALMTVGIRMGHGRRRLTPVLATAGLIIIGGGAAAAAIGRVGPGNAVHLEHASLLQQIPDTDVSLLTMEALATFAAFKETSLQFPLADGTIESSTPEGRAEQRLDENGAPIISGVQALAAQRAFSVEAVVGMQLLAASSNGRQWTVANRSAFNLSQCRFADGLSRGAIGDLLPGARVTAEQTGDILGPVFTCTLHEPWLAVTEGNRRVDVEGPTIVAVYQGEVSSTAASDVTR